MLSLILLRTLNGPIPALFTGDPTHAPQFIQDLDNLVWKNLNHPLVSTPWTRIDMALAFISGPITLAWKHSIRRGDPTETDIDALWQDFLESFCETWVHSPESTISAVVPIVQISTASVPSPSLAATSTPKHTDDISIILPTIEPPTRCLSETIDLTADDDDGWTLFAPCVSAPPPISPPPSHRVHRSISPATTRDESPDPPLTLTLDLSATDSAAQQDEELRYATTSTADCNDATLVTSRVPAISDVPLADERALPTPPRTPKSFAAIVPRHHPLHAYALLRKREHGYEADDEHAYPRKRPCTQLARCCRPLPRQYRYVRRPITLPPPVDDSSGLSKPALDPPHPAQPAESQPSPPSLAFAPPSPRTVVMVDSIGLPTPAPIYQSPTSVHTAQPRRAILHAAIPLQLSSQPFSDAADLAADVEHTPANPAFFTFSSRYSPSRPCLPSRPVLPPILSPLRVVTDDEDLKRAMLTSTFAAFPASRPSAPASRSASPSGISTLSPVSLLDFPAVSNGSPPLLASPRTRSSNIKTLLFTSALILTLDDAGNTVDTVLSTFRPPSPSYAHPLSSMRPPTVIVEDDNIPNRGVKTIEKSVFTRNSVSAKPLVPRYPPIFPRHAFEQPRDPDEVVPTTAQNQNHVVTPAPSADPMPRPTSRPGLRATAAICIPRTQITGPTQSHGIRLARQHHIDLIRAATRTRIRNRHTYTAHHTSKPTDLRPTSPPRPPTIVQNAVYWTTQRYPTNRADREEARPSDNEDSRRLAHTLHRNPRVRFSQTRDRHSHIGREEPTPVRRFATAAIIERVQAWQEQLLSEQTPRSMRSTPHQPPTNRNSHFTFVSNPRNYAYDYNPPKT
ncbi:hypothetical protein EDB85DRAFT_2161768 [Lactarius pseudohatsudake]|nr:hypothetical protein EDB85DRAFT_2161768 [Lactarius pseudohatsudake]